MLLDATFSLTTLDLFLRTMDSKPELFFARHVKGLFLNKIPPESALRIILACSNINKLAYISPLEDVDDDDIGLDIAEAIEDLPLRELYTHFSTFWSLHPDSDCLQQLTHLACWDVSHENVDRILQVVPSLTHLSLPCYFDDSRIIYQAARALAYERIQVLALVGFIFDKRFPLLARDPRVALLQLFPLLPTTDIVIPGDGNLWTIAGRMVEEAYDILEAEANAGKCLILYSVFLSLIVSQEFHHLELCLDLGAYTISWTIMYILDLCNNPHLYQCICSFGHV